LVNKSIAEDIIVAVRLRLRRMGRKKRPFYRIVAADQRAPRDGRFIEILGFYDPLAKPHKSEINEERINYWLDQGAQPSDTVRNLLKSRGILFKRHLQSIGTAEEKIDEEVKKWGILQSDRVKRREAAELQAKKQKAKARAKKAEEAAAEPEAESSESEEIKTTTEPAEKSEQTEDDKDTEVKGNQSEEKIEEKSDSVEETAEEKAEAPDAAKEEHEDKKKDPEK
jgi:small subunit ribosomal protein S16